MVFQDGLANSTGIIGGVKAAISGLWTVISKHPIIAAVAAVGILVAAFDKLHTSAKEANEKMESSFEAYDDAKQKVVDTNAELEETKSKMDDLLAKDSLTFVEESELQKLKDATEQLQIQADLNEKAALRAGRQAAEDTVSAYRKNYKKPISQEQTDEYIRNAELSGNNSILFSDHSNISSMIAGIRQMEKLRDETEKGSEEYELYNSQVKESSDLVWEQVSALSTYKTNLEAIPYDELSQEQKSVLDEISNSIDYVYQELDPAKWKQMKFDRIFDSSALMQAKDTLVTMAKESGNLGITIDDVASKYPELAKAIQDAGFTLDDLVANINSEAGIKNIDEVDRQLKEAFEKDLENQKIEAETKVEGDAEVDIDTEVEVDETSLEDFNNWIDSLEDSDKLIVFDITANQDTSGWTLEDYQEALEKTKSTAADTAESVKMSFHDLMASSSLDADETNTFTAKLDEYVTKINNLKEALDKYRSGKLTDSDLYDLVKTFPDLAGQADNLDEAIINLVNDLISAKDDSGLAGFFDKYMDMMDSDESRQKLEQFYNEIMRLVGLDESIKLSVDFDAEAAKFTNLYAAMKESVSGTGLGTDSIANVKNMFKDLEGYNPEKLFERTANGVHLNSDAVHDLQEQYESLKKQDIADDIQRITDEYSKAKLELNRLKASGQDYSEQEGVVSSLRSQLLDAQLLQAQYDGLTSAYNKWIQAQSGGNERDSLESVAKGYESMQDTLNRGWYGDKALNEYLDLMLSAAERTGDAEADFAKLSKTIEGTSHSLKDYFTFDDSGNFTEQGIDMFLNDVSQTLGEGYAKIDESGEWVFDATGDKLQEIADKFGTSTEMVELFARAMQDAGMHVEFENDLDKLGEDIETAKQKVAELQKDNKISSTLDLNFDTASMGISEIKGKIDELKGERAEIDVETNPEGAAALDELIEKCEQEYYVRLNAETGGGFDQACMIVDQLQAKLAVRNVLSVDAHVQNEEEINALATELASLPSEAQVAVGVTAENVGSVDGIISQLQSDPGSISVPVNYVPGEMPTNVDDAEGTANFKLGDSPKEVPDAKGTANFGLGISPLKVPDAKGTANFTLGSYPTSLPSITQTVIRNVVTNGAQSLGTAHVAGTANSSSGGYSTWATTLPSTKAYVNGTIKDWSLKQPEDALVNETGTEGIVRNGRFMLLPGGAHIEHLKRGDIVFNAAQTEELLKNGRVLSNGGHGRVALAGGTAYNGMPAHGVQASGKTKNWGNSSSSTTTTSSGGGSGNNGGGGSNRNSGNTGNTGQGKSDTEKEKERIDWIEVAISRVERKIQKLKTTADSVYKSFTKRNKKLASEIDQVSAEIDLQEKGYKRYIKEANSIDLDSNLKKKVRDGTIDINEYDEDTQKQINEYQEWYEKALDCKDAVQELNEELSNLYRQQFDLIITKWTDKLQDLQHEAEHTTSIINRRTEYASDYVKPKNSRKASKQNITDYQGLIGNAQSQIKMYEKERNELIDELNSGKVKEGTEAWYEMLAEIQEVDNNIDTLKENIIEYSNSISAEYVNIFDSITAEYENKMGLIEHMSNEVNIALSKAEEKGRLSTTGYYENLKELNAQSVKKLTKERMAMEEAFYDALSSGEIEVGSQAYYDMQNSINGVIESLQQAELEVIKLDNQIRQCKWDNFDFLEERISRITDEADFLIDLMSDENLYQDNGQFSDEGIATVGLHAVNYNTLMAQADDYAEQIKELNKQIALDPYDTNLIKRRDEMIDAQQKAILAANEEKQAIRSLVEDGIKIEIDNLKELVDNYKEALDNSKDLYDYQKRVEEQTKNIAKLEKELTAYKGDTSEETKAQIQRIKLELEQSKEDLEDTEYKHMISAQKEMLDNLVKEYELTLNTRLDNLDALVSDMITQVNLSAVEINNTLTSTADSVGYTMSTEMTNIWAQASAAMEASNLARTTETQRLLDQMVANGTLDRAKADEIKAALGAGDLQGIMNAQNIINKLEAEGLLTAQQATDLRNTVSAPYVGDGVVAMYGKDFSSKMTTTNDALASIKAYCQTMEKKAAEEAAAAQRRIEEEKKQKEAAEKQAQAAAAQNKNNTKPAAAAAAQDKTPATTKDTVDDKKPAAQKTTPEKKKTTTSTQKATSTQGDGKIQVGDQVTYVSGEYYYSSDGIRPTGHQERGNKVYVGLINNASWAKYPYALYRDKGFTRPLGWVAKSQISGYATGLKEAKKNEPAWVNEEGLEAILSPSKSAVITHVSRGDAVLDAEATKNLFAMANDPSGYLGGALFKSQGEVVPGKQDLNLHNEFSITLPNVMNYEDFRRAMQKDPKMEKMLVSMIVEPMLGKSKNSKNRFNF